MPEVECPSCGRTFEVEDPEKYATNEPCVECRPDDERAV